MKLHLIISVILSANPAVVASEFKGINAYPELLAKCQENTYPMDTVEDCVRFSAIKPPPRDLWTKLCLGNDEMEADYKAQKGKYCNCLHNMIFYQQPNESLKNSAMACKAQYPPLN